LCGGGATACDLLRTEVVKAQNQQRAYAALALGVLCERVLGDEAWRERRSAALDALRTVFDTTTAPNIKGGVAIALGIARDAEAGPLLLAAIKNMRDVRFRAYAALALGMVNHVAAGDYLTELLAETDNLPLLRQHVTIGLGLMGSRSVIAPLVETLRKERSSYVLSSTTIALGFIGDRTAIAPLVEVMNEEKLPPLIRGFGIIALGNIADPEPVPVISAIAANHNYLANTECLNQLLYIL